MAGFPKPKNFYPTNPDKIIGDPTKIISRSSWETKVFNKLDKSRDVVKWGSECLVINYRSPKDNMMHRYFPDLVVVAKAKDGSFITTVIEIKPLAQSIPPKANKNAKRYHDQVMVYAINQAKWKAAELWCEQRNISFKVMTELDIFFK